MKHRQREADIQRTVENAVREKETRHKELTSDLLDEMTGDVRNLVRAEEERDKYKMQLRKLTAMVKEKLKEEKGIKDIMKTPIRRKPESENPFPPSPTSAEFSPPETSEEVNTEDEQSEAEEEPIKHKRISSQFAPGTVRRHSEIIQNLLSRYMTEESRLLAEKGYQDQPLETLK